MLHDKHNGKLQPLDKLELILYYVTIQIKTMLILLYQIRIELIE
jgi:hypothetical protein